MPFTVVVKLVLLHTVLYRRKIHSTLSLLIDLSNANIVAILRLELLDCTTPSQTVYTCDSIIEMNIIGQDTCI